MLKYEKFKQTIRNVIQSSGLDIGMVFFILKDITREIGSLYEQQLQKEALEEQQKAQPEEEEKCD